MAEELTTQDYFNQMKSLKETGEEQARMDVQSNRFKVYIDNFVDQVDELIKSQFHPDNYHLLRPMKVQYFNLLKKIVNLKSVLYKQPALRKWLVGDTENDKYSELLEGSNINTSAQTLNKFVNVNNVAFMRVKTDLINKVLRYDAVPAESIMILQDILDPYKINALMRKINIPAGLSEQYDEQDVLWAYWDSERYLLLNDQMDILEEKDNVYKDPNTGKGIIPYVPFWGMQPIANNFWNETINDDLYEGTVQINANMTHFNNVLKTTCYRQLALTGLHNEDVKKLYGHIVDGLSPIAMQGEEAKADSFEMTGQVREFMDSIHDIISQIADQHGVSFSSQATSAQKQSGLALEIEQEALDNLREEQEPLFRDSENELAKVSIIIGNTDLNAGVDVNGKLDITFPRPNKILSPDEIAGIGYEVNEGYKSKTEVFMSLNPSTQDTDEAESQMIKNIEIKPQQQSTSEIETAFAQSPASPVEQPESEEEITNA
jgi:hypothetical protein